jgi:hypothetical protein
LIAGLSLIASPLFQAIQKPGHDLNVKLVPAKLGNPFSSRFCRKLQEKSYGVRVTRYRVWPQSPLKPEVVAEE